VSAASWLRRNWKPVAGVAAVGGVLAIASRRRTTRRTTGGGGGGGGGGGRGGGGEGRLSANEIRELAAPLAHVMSWPDLPDFLAVVAYTESGYNPKVASCANNKACGLYGLRYKTSRLAELGQPPEMLHDARWATFADAWLSWRLGHMGYHFPGQVVDWLAIRRGMAFPKLVADVDEKMPVKGYAPGERSADVRERMEKGVAHAGLPDSFMYEPAYQGGAFFPGVDAMLAAMNLVRVA
jgi:hypothetical protein